MYTLSLYHDFYRGNVTCDLQVQHAILYVLKGAAEINGISVAANEAVYGTDLITIKTTADTTIWRYEIAPTSCGSNIITALGVVSHLKMALRPRMFELAPRTRWLFRLDTIIKFKGSTGLHSHPALGIRCLVEGGMRIESKITVAEESYSNKQGDVWYEEGSYPIISTADDGGVTFLRGMILPAEYVDFGETATWIEGVDKKPEFTWKLYKQQVVTLI